MRPASIAAAQQRVIQSRRELRGAFRRLGASLARPASLFASAGAAAFVAFSLTRLGGGGVVASALSLYVRYRTEKAGAARKMSAMSTITPQMRTLQRALKDFAGEAELAKVLGVSVEVLSGWLRGEEALPATIYLRALDLVATGR